MSVVPLLRIAAAEAKEKLTWDRQLGEVVRYGVGVVFVGPPNVRKCKLFSEIAKLKVIIVLGAVQ